MKKLICKIFKLVSIESYEKMRITLDNEIRTLQEHYNSQILNYEDNIKALRREIERLEQENKFLRDELSVAKKKIEELLLERDGYLQQIKSLEELLSKERKENLLQKVNYENLLRENDSLKVSLKSYDVKIKHLEENLREQQEAYKKNIERVREEYNETLKHLNSELEDNRKQVETEKQYLNEKLADANEIIEGLSNEKDDCLKQIKNFDSLLSKERSDALLHKNNSDNLAKENASLRESVKLYKERIEQNEENLSAKEKQLKDEHAGIVEKLHSEQQVLKEINTKLREELDVAKSEFSKKMDLAEKTIQDLSKLNEEKSLKIIELSEDVEKIAEDTSQENTSSNSKEECCDKDALTIYRFLQLCKSISQQSDIQGVIVTARRLTAEFFHLQNYTDFTAFLHQVISVNPNFQKEDSIQTACFGSILCDIKKKLDDKIIIKNAIDKINEIRLNNQFKNRASNGVNETTDSDGNDYYEENIELNNLQINKTEKEIIQLFKDVCYSLSCMYTLNPQLKSIYKIAIQSIYRYSKGVGVKSFYSFVSCRTLEKATPYYIKNCHVRILELIIKENKKKDEIIVALQKDNRIFPQPVQRHDNRKNNLSDDENTLFILPYGMYSLKEINIKNNNKILLNNGSLYLNSVSKKTRIKTYYSSLTYTTDNIYITHFRSKRGLIYLDKKKVHNIWGVECDDVKFDKDMNRFELHFSQKKMKLLSVDQIMLMVK